MKRRRRPVSLDRLDSMQPHYIPYFHQHISTSPASPSPLLSPKAYCSRTHTRTPRLPCAPFSLTGLSSGFELFLTQKEKGLRGDLIESPTKDTRRVDRRDNDL